MIINSIKALILLLTGITLSVADPLKSIYKSLPLMDTLAQQMILVDYETGSILLEKNGEEFIYPSSMTKIVTLDLIFSKIKAHHFTLDTLFPVSEKAWRFGGSKMFVSLNTMVSLRDLVMGISVVSGNDACVVVGEGMAGSEEAFAREMTEHARQLGALNSTFKNASGWPDPDHLTTVRDLAILARHVILRDYYGIYKEKSFTYNGIQQANRNPLLYKNIGCDGIKTGHTEKGGYGLVASVLQNDHRLILVVNGLPSDRARAEEALKLFSWGFNVYGRYVLFKAGQLVDTAPVLYGQEDRLPLTITQDGIVILPKGDRKNMKVSLNFNSPLMAPISKGTVVGKIVVQAPSLMQPWEFPLVAAVSIEKSGFFKRLKDSISYLLWGKS